MDSDHLGLGLCAGVEPVDRKRPARWVRRWRDFEQEGFIEELRNVNWGETHVADPTATLEHRQVVMDNMCESFTHNLLTVLDNHAPRVFYAASEQKRYRRRNKPWVDRKLIALIRSKDRLRQKARLSPADSPVHIEYECIRKQFSKALRKNRREFVKSKMEAAGNDQKKLWKVMAEITGYKEVVQEDVTEISAQSFADMLSSHMTSTPPPMESVPRMTSSSMRPSFEIKQVSTGDVEAALRHIDPNKSTGVDLIPPQALKHAAPVVASPLANIINSSIQLQCFPRLWRRARISPIYKNKGSKRDTVNYRPISIICAAAMVCERLVSTQLCDYLEDNRCLDDRQHGFRRRRDTCHAVLQTVDEAVKWLGGGTGRLAAFLALDCSKAFDMVSHESILQALAAHGVTKTSVEWFMQYLTDRECVVQIGTDTATGFTPRRGVPQGSILGPISFLLSVDLQSIPGRPEDIAIIYQQYADDITLVIQASNIENLVARTEMLYEKVTEFLMKLGVSVNGGKSQWMVVGTRQRLSKVPPHLSVVLDGERVPRMPTMTVLGVVIDECLSFTPHMEAACSKASGRLRLLIRKARRLPARHRRSLAHALIYSSLTYCDAAMCNVNQRWLDRIDEIQRGAARFFLGTPTRPRKRRCPISGKSYCWNTCCNSKDCITQLGWIPLSEKRHMHLAGRVWSSCHDLHWPQSMHLTRQRTGSTRTRGAESNALEQPSWCKTAFGKKAFSVQGPSEWNNLPTNIRQATSLQAFREQYKSNWETIREMRKRKNTR